MYTEIQVSYGPVMFVNLKDFYLEKRKDTTGEDKDAILSYYLVGVYSGRDYDLDENVYLEVMEKYNTMMQDELSRETRISNMILSKAGQIEQTGQTGRVGRPRKDVEI